MINLGRNDPCHCGSGKKYKKCHLAADQREHNDNCLLPPYEDSPVAFLDIENVPERLRQLSEQGSAVDREMIDELQSTIKPFLDYEKHRNKVEAASTELERHRSEFEKLEADEHRYLARAQTLFAEERFQPLRFTAAEIQDAFVHVGYPAMIAPDRKTGEVLRKAILHIAAKRGRSRLSLGLLLQLPELVAARRYLDGWLVQQLAFDTVDGGEESNAFLFQMFSYGYDAWAAEKHAKDEEMVRRLGLDPDRLRTMSLDQIDSLIQSRSSDAEWATALKTFLDENARVREESIANLNALTGNSRRLLEREDSRFLHLGNEEVQPWLTQFNERALRQEFLSDTREELASDYDPKRLFEELLLPLLREMAKAIFTPERVRHLVEDLKKYRNDRWTAGDQETARQAMGAIYYVERQDCPGQNTFLLSLCWTSLQSAMALIGVEEARPD